MEMWNEWGAHAWYEIWMGEIAKARQKFAAIIGAQLHEVAIAPSVSVALSSIASALDYSKRNNVVMADMDFPTLAYQWLVKQRIGVECRFVESPDRIYTPPELFEREVDDKTALVATSRVFYTSGYIQDIRSVADIAHKHGAYMLVDDYQGTGQIPINVNAMEFDFRPDATRVEMGTPAVAAIYAANGGLDIVQEISVEQICERTRYLTNDLIAQAREHGWKVRAPLEPEQRSSIVMLEIEQPEEVVKALVARNIITDSRPGLLRASPYFYNTIEENALVIGAIAEILESRK